MSKYNRKLEFVYHGNVNNLSSNATLERNHLLSLEGWKLMIYKSYFRW